MSKDLNRFPATGRIPVQVHAILGGRQPGAAIATGSGASEAWHLTKSSDETSLPLHRAARVIGVSFSHGAAPRDHFVDVNGLRLHYLDWGSADAPPLLMLHGMAQTAHSWDFAALAFCDRYRVVALDQRGHGDSDWAADGDYTLDAHQRDLQAAVEALGLRDTVLIGLSMGGRNAFSYAALHPERVRALVVVDSAPVLMRYGAETIRRFVRDMDEMDSFEEFVTAVWKFNPRRTEEHIRGSLEHNLKRLPGGRWTWKYDKALRSGAIRPWSGPELISRMWGYVERVRCPTLLVRGAHSSVLSQDTAEEMAARLDDGRLAVVPDAGHLVPGDNPAGFHRAVEDFFEEVGLTAL